MALLDEAAERARALDRRPFASGYEGQSWMSLWCYDCARYEDCPLLLVALSGKTPAAWEERKPSSLNRYTCHEYTDSNSSQDTVVSQED